MCGLAGFTNVAHGKRPSIVLGLGLGADTRGRHSAGYVSTSGPGATTHYGRKSGPWGEASDRFVFDAAQGVCTILHSRYATCGVGDERTAEHNAHPFAIKRADRTAVWGAHNGMLDNARASALAHGRTYTVDSRELFELLADGQLDKVRKLEGYGTLAWIERASRDRVRLVRLTQDADLVVARTACGGLVWASTRGILDDALDMADMTLHETFTIDTGKVVECHADGTITYSEKYPEPLTLAERPKWGSLSRASHWRDYTSLATAGAGAYTDADWDSADDLDDDECGECPHCHSLDTWLWQGYGQCSDCGETWPFVALPSAAGAGAANDAGDDNTPDIDAEAFAAWLARDNGGARCT